MKPFHHYTKTSTGLPNKKDYETIYLYHAGKVLWEGHWYDCDYPDALDDLKIQYPGAVQQDVLDTDAYNEHKLAYQEEKERLWEKFKQDLFEEYGVSDNSKRFDCFTLAYSRRKGEELEHIYKEFSELCPLIT